MPSRTPVLGGFLYAMVLVPLGLGKVLFLRKKTILNGISVFLKALELENREVSRFTRKIVDALKKAFILFFLTLSTLATC